MLKTLLKDRRHTPHEHWDHTGGNEAFKKITGAKNISPSSSKRIFIPVFAQGLKAGDKIPVGDSINLRVLNEQRPGHTCIRFVYMMKMTRQFYTGDTLFNCGLAEIAITAATQKSCLRPLKHSFNPCPIIPKFTRDMIMSKIIWPLQKTSSQSFLPFRLFNTP